MLFKLVNSGLHVWLAASMIHVALGVSPLYTFNEPVNEMKITDVSKKYVNVSVPIIYQGRSFDGFFISVNGYVAFVTDPKYVEYHPANWSMQNAPPSSDIPFIAPYYYRGCSLDIMNDYTGHIFYQELLPTDSQQPHALSVLGDYISTQFIDNVGFDPKWGMVITWENVTSSRLVESQKCQDTDSNPCQTNTFQLALLTDGVQSSYAIINYGILNIPPEHLDQAGFNGGDKTGWTDVYPISRSVSELNQHQSSNTVGRYLFRISDRSVLRGGCSIDLLNTQLTIQPKHAGMFGGKMIDISGPCFTNSNKILCRFGDQSFAHQESLVTKAIFVNQLHVRCIVPRLLIRDSVKLSLSLDNGLSYPYYTYLTIVFPGRMSSLDHVTTVADPTNFAWYDYKSTSMTLKWNQTLLSNTTTDQVDIILIGYRESDGIASYKNLTTLGTNIHASQGVNSYTIDARQYQCIDEDCLNYEVGLVAVILQDHFTPQTYKFLSSQAIPLAWYVQNAMSTRHGTNWPSTMCVDWYNRDRQNTVWLNSLLNCPCSLAQAMSDFGRWQPDVSCNILASSKPENCFYHNTAIHCVRSVQAVNGACNQCCYSKSGSLIFTEDTFQGSTPDKSHDWGALPYGKPGYVPSLSHWLDDVVTFYYCCLWTKHQSCDYYMDLRPTKDCTGYTPPMPAQVFGEGHIRTFASDTYRILGKGDYVLLKTDDTIIQGRFENNPLPTKDGGVVTSVFALTGVSAQITGISSKVELRLFAPRYSTIDVKVDGQYVLFNDESLAWQDFKGLSILNSDRDDNGMSNFTVMLANGVGFQVKEDHGVLQLDLMVPANTFHHVSGLFGDLNGITSTSNGTVVNVSASATTAHMLFNVYEFSWGVINLKDSLFQDHLPIDSKSDPMSMDPLPLPGINEHNAAFCAGNKECIFDYRYTGSEDIAHDTLSASLRYTALRQNLMPVRSCGLLNVPRSIKSNYEYTVGTVTTITGCRKGELSGESLYTCVETSNYTQNWSPAVTSTCSDTAAVANIGMIVGVTLGSVVCVLIIAVIIVVIRKHKQHSRSRSSKTNVDIEFSEEQKHIEEDMPRKFSREYDI